MGKHVIVHADNDTQYTYGMYQACVSIFSTELDNGKYYVCQPIQLLHDSEIKSLVSILLINLDDVSVSEFLPQIHSQYAKAFIIGYMSVMNPARVGVESLAYSLGAHLVITKHEKYGDTLSNIFQMYNNWNHQKSINQQVNPTMENPQSPLPWAQINPEAIPSANLPPMSQYAGTEDKYFSAAPQVYAVSGSKGGVGKTTIAVEMATILARLRDNSSGRRMKVLLWDLDLDFPGIPAVLNQGSVNRITEWVSDIERKKAEGIKPMYNEAFITERFLKRDDKRELYLLLPTNNPKEAANITPEHIQIILETLKQYFHYIVIDLGNNMRHYSMKALTSATHRLLVTMPTSVAMKKTIDFVTVLQSMDFPINTFKLVINGEHKDLFRPSEVTKMMTERWGILTIGVIPNWDQVKVIQNQNKTVMEWQMETKSETEFGRSILHVVAQVNPLVQASLGKGKAIQEEGLQKKDKGIKGFLKSLIGG